MLSPCCAQTPTNAKTDVRKYCGIVQQFVRFSSRAIANTFTNAMITPTLTPTAATSKPTPPSALCAESYGNENAAKMTALGLKIHVDAMALATEAAKLKQ